MNAQDLKNSILQLAIQGKLVEQRKEEGTAKELLDQMEVEKKKLIKEGKIKNEKSLPPIKEDEVPFDIPESWEWVRLSEIVDVRDGTHDTPKYVVNGVPLVTSKNLKQGEIDFDNVKLISFEESEKINMRSGVDDGDILFAMIGSIGNPVLVKKNRDFSIKNMALFKPINSTLFNMEYLLEFLKLEQQNMKRQAAGGVQSFVSLTFLRKYLVPLPPLEEQKRIVAKIEELKSYVDKYDKAYTEAEGLNKRFPEDVQKSILQYAIQGKLVEQREEDGTTEELYKHIQEEKKKLVKDGKIKKNTALPEITEDEIPFDIPENWKWVRLGDIFEINPRNNVSDETSVSFIPMTLIEDGYRSQFTYETKQWGEVKKGYTHFQNGDIAMAKITPCFQNLKSAIMENLENGVGAGTTELHVLRSFSSIYIEFFLWFIKSPNFVATCVKNMTGTAGQKRVPTDIVKNYVAPLPPLEEQKRIVEKIEKLLPYTKQLVK